MDATEENTQSLKRKRTPEQDTQIPQVAPPPKAPKTASLVINYFARQIDEDLPLITTDDSLHTLLGVLNRYAGVLERHESMAINLGARPLGPMIFRKVEKMFDGPPKVLKNSGKDGSRITWLDVIDFAKSKPEQFQLGQLREGKHVCQFYTKQCRVEISEDDYHMIKQGIPQKVIPSQPVLEDEENELATLEILEEKLVAVIHAADQGELSGSTLHPC
jgi:hypothetical protein